MGFLPQESLWRSETSPTRTYAVDFESGGAGGMLEGAKAMEQAVFKRLATGRGEHPIYSASYGFLKRGLVGRERPYVRSELRRRITEALEGDERISGLSCMTLEDVPEGVSASFRVHTQFGEIERKWEWA